MTDPADRPPAPPGSSRPPPDERALQIVEPPINSPEAPGALVPVPPPPPPLRLARSLDEADRRSLLHIDARGRVRSPARYHALDALGYTWAGLLVFIGIYAYAQLFGPVGALLASAVLAGAFAFGASRRNRMARVAALIADNRLVE